MQIRITKLRVAMAALIVLAGVGLGTLLSPLVGSALAVSGQAVNISWNGDRRFANVVDGGLWVSNSCRVADPREDCTSKIPLTVGGTVTVDSSRPAAPASPWAASLTLRDETIRSLVGPSALPINLTSLSVSTDAPSGSGIFVTLFGYHVPSDAVSCDAPTFDQRLWVIRDVGDGVTPVSFTFPTPLQWKPPANTKACLMARATTLAQTTLNAVGFYGG